MGTAPAWKTFLRRRFAVFVLVLVVLGTAWHFGAFDVFRDPDRVHALLESWGSWAYVIYLATFIVLMPFGIPAFVWVLPAGVLWPFWVAYPLSLVAVAGGSSLGFVFARYVARDWVAARVPPRIRRLDERFTAHGVFGVILFRLVFQLGAPTHWLLGLSKLDYGRFVVGTVIGAMPAVALVAWLGHDAFHWVEMHTVLSGGILVVAVAVGVVVRRVVVGRAGGKERVP